MGLGLGWLASLALAAWLAGRAPSSSRPPEHDAHSQRALLAQIDDLKQQVANLERSAQVNEVATRSLRGTLAQREEELNGLRTDLGFYSRLVGGDARGEGLKLQEVRLQPITGSRGWNLDLGLTRNARRGSDVEGKALVAVEGLSGDKVERLEWPALGDTAQKDGMPFHFTYFQQLHGTIVLPEGFRPTRLRIRIQPSSGAPIEQAVAWGAALNGNLTMAQGEHDAQP